MCAIKHASYMYQACEKHNGPVDDDTLKSILGRFMDKMGSKWDFIGIQLKQGDLVTDLRPELGSQKVQSILDAWFLSDDKDVPVCIETILRVLRSEAVNLGAVATKIEKVMGTVHALNVFRQC